MLTFNTNQLCKIAPITLSLVHLLHPSPLLKVKVHTDSVWLRGGGGGGRC
jgi:hypothetical protein